MTLKKLWRKSLVWLLAVAMILSVTPIHVFAEGVSALTDVLNRHKTVYVLAGTDFQPLDDDPATGAKQVNEILSAIKKAGYHEMDGFLFAGDYEKNAISSAEEATAGKNVLQAAVQDVYGTEMQEIYVQGNHDPDSLVDDGTLTSGGAHDTEKYGVFVVHEKDYMWEYGDRATVQATAEALQAYLDEKLAVGYCQPIFIIAHLPLHYSMRTYRNGDAKDADLLFHVINTAGEQGLNIIYLFGHDHAQGWDDYMGGASVYLQAGDKINIAQGSQKEFTEETLAFTYMNAGYVGYYSDDNATGVDSTLTMTLFEITDNQVVISRYSAEGLHDLKSVGKIGSIIEETERDYYAPNTLTYDSPQTLNGFASVTDVTGTVTVRAATISDVTLHAKSEKTVDGFRKYVAYDIRSDSYQGDGTAIVTVKLEEGYVEELPVTVVDLLTGEQMIRRIHDGTVTFNVNRMGEYAVTQTDLLFPVTDTKVTESKIYEKVDALVSGKSYVIANSRSGYAVTNRIQNGTLLLDPSAEWYENTWYFWISQGQMYLRTAANGSYLSINNSVTEIVPDKVGFDFCYYPDTQEWTIKQNGQYLNQIGQATSTMVGGYVVGYDDPNSRWFIYRPRTLAPKSVTLRMDLSALVMYVGDSMDPAPTVTVDDVATSQYVINWTSSDPDVLTVENGQLKALSEGLVTVTATLASANREILFDCPSVEIQVAVKNRKIKSMTVDQEWVTVSNGIAPTDNLGTVVTVAYEDGLVEQIPVTASMLEGEFNLQEPGTYENLTVKWQDLVVTEQFTLTVVDVDYPSYPQPGGMSIKKKATAVDFAFSGLSKVELSVAGMSVQMTGEEILPAATDATVLETLGTIFCLMRGNHQYTVVENGERYIRTQETSVTICAYDLYTADDVDGITVTADMIGTRKGTATVLETITFNAAGTEAYSDRLAGNILENGVICAQTFIYNGNEKSLRWDFDGDGVQEGFLLNNSIYWTVGTLGDTEVTLTYYAYLSDSMEGTRDTGEYDMSRYISVVYKNWRGNDCWMSADIVSECWTQLDNKNGIYGKYFYIDGVRQTTYQLIEYHDGNYYFVNKDYRIAENTPLYIPSELLDGVVLPDGSAFPEGLYWFDADGKMIDPPVSKPDTDPEAWLCTCGQENSGKFCSECGSPKADSEPETETEPETWLCTCGQENSGKFCSECGSPQVGSEPDSETEPETESETWLCACGHGNDGKFCSECGAPGSDSEPETKTESETEPEEQVPSKGCRSAVAICIVWMIPIAAVLFRKRKSGCLAWVEEAT